MDTLTQSVFIDNFFYFIVYNPIILYTDLISSDLLDKIRKILFYFFFIYQP